MVVDCICIVFGCVGTLLNNEDDSQYLTSYCGIALCNPIGFDIKNERIKELKNGFDNTKEIEKSNLVNNNNLIFTNNEEDISKAVFLKGLISMS